MDGIIEFCELGDFLDQPFKTYSLGMQARLMFAAATAIRPDILIVDEVLGAGDAYFVAKSKIRVEKLVSSGCTMLLVSHSMQQVLELCDEAIWLERGVIKMRGESFLVVKAYEESLHGRLQSTAPVNVLQSAAAASDLNGGENDSPIDQAVGLKNRPRRFELPDDVKLQNPVFLPHSIQPTFPDYSPADVAKFNFVAPGGISRWDAKNGVKLVGFSIQTERGFANTLLGLRPAKFILSLLGEFSADFSCRYGIAINDLLGNVAARIYSPPDRFYINESEVRIVEMVLNPVQLGPGEYTLGISVLEATELELINSATRYDLLGRSFSLKVELEETLSPISANFIHSAEWNFREGV
jgi:lipopolysaccharide transport system ATP-binding protein